MCHVTKVVRHVHMWCDRQWWLSLECSAWRNCASLAALGVRLQPDTTYEGENARLAYFWDGTIKYALKLLLSERRWPSPPLPT